MDRMTKSHKIMLIIATFMPFLFVAIWFVSFFFFFGLSMAQPGHGNGEPPPAMFITMFGFQALMMVWGIGLFVLYLVHLFKTDRVKQERKALWGVVLFLGGIVAMLVYWFMYVWPEPEPAETTPDTA
jgi:predicted membrane channel-forming protein YqfA (hemolysin III family)